MNEEQPIAKTEAVLVEYANKKGGKFATFLISGGPDDNYEGIATLALGEVIMLYVTKMDIGV